MAFKPSRVAILSQVKYFMGTILNRNDVIDILTFQGSQDGLNYTDVFVVDQNIHDGWNYYKWENGTDQPKYRYYRFSGKNKGSCLINEIKFSGVETIDNLNPIHTCEA
jgi:hypothetical protein